MKLLFLPGASGSREFWDPARRHLKELGPSRVVGWPGLGGVPACSEVTQIGALVDIVLAELGPDTHVIAQSMGSVVALMTALSYQNSDSAESIASLVLVAAAGGLDMKRLGATDWRKGAHEWQPQDAPRYFFDDRSDFAARLSAIQCPVLLVSGGADPLSPPSVSKQLQALLPNAKHVSLEVGEHDLASVHSEWIAAQIRAHVLGERGSLP